MSEYDFKEVYFHEYCSKCEHYKEDDTEEPCNECLENPSNEFSHKPVKFEEKINGSKTI